MGPNWTGHGNRVGSFLKGPPIRVGFLREERAALEEGAGHQEVCVAVEGSL